MDYKNFRFDSYGKLTSPVVVSKTESNDTPHHIPTESFDEYDEEYLNYIYNEYEEETEGIQDIQSLIFEYLEKYEDSLSIFKEENSFCLQHNDLNKSVILYYNVVDDSLCGFILKITIGGREHSLDNITYTSNNFHDDIFDDFLRAVIDKYDLDNKNPFAVLMNEYLDLLYPPNFIKEESFWDIYQRIKKEFGQAHFKDGFIYFNNVRCFVNKGNILYMGYIETNVDTFIAKYKNNKFAEVNKRFCRDNDFKVFIKNIFT